MYAPLLPLSRNALYSIALCDQIKLVRATAEEDRAAMLEIVQSKAEELLRREEEGKTMRLLYESEVRCKQWRPFYSAGMCQLETTAL